LGLGVGDGLGLREWGEVEGARAGGKGLGEWDVGCGVWGVGW
jgi:hypothetical protein